MSDVSSSRRGAAELVAIPCDQWQMSDLVNGVQVAVELELSTLPPYLCGVWSIDDGGTSEARTLLGGVIQEEMLHMGLMCNMLAGLGGTFDITPPIYPGGLPGGVRPDLTVSLTGLTTDQVGNVFMGIELPEDGPITAADPGPTIGSFYDCIAAAIEALQPSFDETHQLDGIQIGPEEGFNVVYKIGSVADALRAIEEIKEQGEGTSQSPDAVDEGGELAHYYRFGELFNGKEFVQGPDGTWSYSGPDVPWPSVFPVVAVPAGGWPDPVPPEMTEFRAAFASLLTDLQNAFTGKGTFDAAYNDMVALHNLAGTIVQTPLPGGGGNYLPDFRAP